jgi:hypothetical protein
LNTLCDVFSLEKRRFVTVGDQRHTWLRHPGAKQVQEIKLMKYLLLMYADPSIGTKYSQEELQAQAEAWYAYMEEAKAAGVLISNGGLDPAARPTTVRIRDGKTLTTDGPFAETHEQVGGYSLLDCKDLDEAIRWAEKIPSAKYGSVEICPLWSPNQ